MNFKEMIQYRNQLIENVSNGKKLAQAEKEWLRTTPQYNEKYDTPCLQRDILKIKQNVTFRINVRCEKETYDGNIFPLVSVVMGKGNIKANTRDPITAEMNFKENIKSLAVLIDETESEASFLFHSKNGLISVEYLCEHYEEHLKRNIRASSIFNLAYGMTREDLAENKIRYSCKSPVGNDDFNALIFTIEWIEEKNL